MTDTQPPTLPERDVMVERHLPSYLDDRAPGSYFPNPSPDGPTKFMTWDYVIQVLSHGDLDQLFRDPVCDTAYRAFAPSARAKYNGIENYIRTVRLGWPAEELTGPVGPNMLDKPPKDPLSILNSSASTPASGVNTPNGTRLPVEAVKETWPEKVLPHPTKRGIVLRHFVEDATSDGEFGESLVKTIPNDWPYGIPAGCSHWVVWSKLPILHPSLFATPDTPFPDDEALREELYNCVTGDGIRGFTGFIPSSDQCPAHTSSDGTIEIPEVLGTYSQSKLAHLAETKPTFEQGILSKQLIAQAHAWASRHVTKYIEAIWPKDRFKTAWFCNPPNLRTVPGLSHFQ